MPRIGEFWVSKPHPNFRCHAFTLPPGMGGSKVKSLDPGTIFGPIERIATSDGFVAVLTQGVWITVSQDMVRFAFRANYIEMLLWQLQGWQSR